MFIDGYHGHNPLSFPPPLPLAGGMHFRSPPQRKMHSGLHVVASCTQSLTPDALELLLKVSEGVLHLAIGRERAPRSERPVSPRHHHHRKESTDRGGHHVGCGLMIADQGKSKRSNDRRLPPIVKNGVVLPSKGVVPLCLCGVSIVASADDKRGAWQADATAMGRWGREPADRAAAEEALLALGGESGPFCIRRHKDKNKRETDTVRFTACMHAFIMHTIMHSRGHGGGQSYLPTWCTPQCTMILPV